MRFKAFATVLALLGTCLLVRGQVVSLKDENFESYIASKKLVILKIFAPWCGHCQRLAPEYEKAARQAQEKKRPYEFLEIDGTQNPKSLPYFKVAYYPTLKVFHNGVMANFTGPRTAEGLLKFMDKLAEIPEEPSQPEPVVTLANDDFEAYLARSEQLVLLKLYAPWCGHCKRLAPEYEKAGKDAREAKKPYVFAQIDCTTSPKASEKYNLTGYPTLKLIKAGEVLDTYTGPRTADAITRYMDEKAGIPASEGEEVIKLTDFNYKTHVNSPKLGMIKVFAPWCGHCKKLAPDYLKAAKVARAQGRPYYFAEIDGTTNSGAMEFFGVKSYPTLKIVKDGKVEEYDGDRSVEGLLKAMDQKAGISRIKELKSLDEIKAIVALPTFRVSFIANSNRIEHFGYRQQEGH